MGIAMGAVQDGASLGGRGWFLVALAFLRELFSAGRKM